MEVTVTFCVGGQFFTTSRDTLMKEPSCRLALITRGVIPATQDAQGVYFIDRDPKYVQLLLNFLRDGWCLLPQTPEERMELLHELRFYQLGAMEAWVHSQDLVAGSPVRGLGTSPRAPLPTVAYTGSPGRRVLYTIPSASGYAAQTGYMTPGFNHSPSAAVRSPTWTPSSAGPHQPRVQQYATASSASPGHASGRPPSGGAAAHPMRAVFMEATAAGPSPAAAPAYSIPQGEDGQGKWTAKYLRTNDGLREVANTLLELAYMPPHRSLHAGKVSLRISSECKHDRPSSLLASGLTGEAAKGRPEVITVRSTSGWSFQLNLKPGSSESDLFDKYNMSEFVQDNWFVLSAVLKDQFGVQLEEDTAERPSCPACRRAQLAVTMSKIY